MAIKKKEALIKFQRKNNMGVCKKDVYTCNDVVTHSPLVCFGGFGQSACQFLDDCLRDNGCFIKTLKSGRRTVRRLKKEM